MQTLFARTCLAYSTARFSLLPHTEHPRAFLCYSTMVGWKLDDVYKARKEAFVTGLPGGPGAEVIAAVATFPVSQGRDKTW